MKGAFIPMLNHTSTGRKIFLPLNYILLMLLATLCIFPMLHVLALSLSSSTAVVAGQVKLWPVGFNLMSYKFALDKPEFTNAFLVSLQRITLGVPINLFMTLFIAYPLSKEKKAFRARGFFAWFFLITILFSGGLIPSYMVISRVGLIDKIWALVIPGAVPVFNVILLLNFFRGLPKELEEAAYIDGAGHIKTLMKIYLPLSKPALATIALFIIVGHWNSWFDGLIYMNSPQNYPLQSYLQTTVINIDTRMMTERDVELLKMINDRTSKAAEIFIAMIPILLIYPFLQRYFTTGIVLGSVKG